MRVILSVAMACLAVACDKVPTDENLAKQAVRERLVDPESAQFSELFRGPNNNGAVCGLVNAKNRMGGYVGRAPFYYSKSSGHVALVGEPLEDRDFIAYYHAIGGPSAIEKEREMTTRCSEVREWELACGSSLHRTPHRLCDKMNDRSFVFMLHKLVNGE